MNELSRQQLTALLIFVLMILVSCSPPHIHQEFPEIRESGSYYQSEFQVPEAEEELDGLAESVMMVFSNTHYKTYWFERDRKIDYLKITTDVLDQAARISYLTNSVSGTATLLTMQSRNAIMVSCAHIFQKPDTIRTYYYDEESTRRIGLESVSIRTRQQNYVRELAGQENLDILLLDVERDLSLLRQPLKEKSPLLQKLVFQNPIGLSKDLKWGSQVYVLGFPKGYKMLTSALVSKPNRWKNDFFMVDGLFNPGLSGGLVLALRNKKPYFEMVGIATSSAATYEEHLIPGPSKIITQSELYLDDIYATRTKRINYGITRVTSSEEIVKWLFSNREKLKKWHLFESLDIRAAD